LEGEYEISIRENPPVLDFIAALDEFLAFVQTKHQQGLVIYATPGEINTIIKDSE